MRHHTFCGQWHQRREHVCDLGCKDFVPELPPSAVQPRSSNLVRCVAWVQLGCCIVFIGLLLLLDPQDLSSRQQQQQVVMQPWQQQQQHLGNTSLTIRTSQQETGQRQPPTAGVLLDARCVPVMVCNLLSKLSHTAHLHNKHCSNPGIRHSGLLPSCTISAAKFSLLLLDVCGLLLAIALLHMTWPRGVPTVVPGRAWVLHGSLPVCQQQLRDIGQFRSDSCSGSVYSPGPEAGNPPAAAVINEGWPVAASGGHWFAITAAAATWVSRRSRWIDAILLLCLLPAVVLAWILLSQ